MSVERHYHRLLSCKPIDHTIFVRQTWQRLVHGLGPELPERVTTSVSGEAASSSSLSSLLPSSTMIVDIAIIVVVVVDVSSPLSLLYLRVLRFLALGIRWLLLQLGLFDTLARLFELLGDFVRRRELLALGLLAILLREKIVQIRHGAAITVFG